MAFNFRTLVKLCYSNFMGQVGDCSNNKKKFGYIKNINVAENHEGYLKSVDFNDFIDKSQCQSWNSEIFKSIIDFDRKWKAIFKKKNQKTKI